MGLNVSDIKTVYMSNAEYKALLYTIRGFNIDIPNVDNNLAFSFTIDGGQPTIVFRNVVKDLSDDIHKAITAHEMAHLSGIKGEEDADRYALSLLSTEEEKDVLRNQWEYRHGHKYEETHIRDKPKKKFWKLFFVILDVVTP